MRYKVYAYDANRDKITFYYYDCDHLGSVRQVITATGSNKGTVVQRMDYYPFGAQLCGGTNDSNFQSHKYNFSIEREKRKLACSSEREKNRPKVNGKEFDKMHGLNTYDYGARQYNPILGRWDRMDPLCEKYYSISPYAYCGNNPVRYIDPNGMYFDESNEKKAKKIERKAERRAARLERKAIRKEMRGKDPGNLNERAQELRKSVQDIRDMRDDKSIEYVFTNTKDKRNKAGFGKPSTDMVGTNDNGHPVVCMFALSNFGSKLHENKHGGQIARSELSLDKSNYNITHEIEAYRAQLSWKGSFSYYKRPEGIKDIIFDYSNGSFYLKQYGTVSSFDEINEQFINSLEDPDGSKIYNFK